MLLYFLDVSFQTIESVRGIPPVNLYVKPYAKLETEHGTAGMIAGRSAMNQYMIVPMYYISKRKDGNDQ